MGSKNSKQSPPPKPSPKPKFTRPTPKFTPPRPTFTALPLTTPSSIIQKSGCDLNTVSSELKDNVVKQVIQTQDSVMSQYDIILNQLNQARTLNDQLSSTNASLWKTDAKQKSQISNLSTSLHDATEQIHIDKTTIESLNDSVTNLTAIRERLENENNGLVADKIYLQKKNILDKTQQNFLKSCCGNRGILRHIGGVIHK